MSLHIECAELSLIGGREENQDRVLVADGDGATIVVVIDGMGGHSDGAKAAEVAKETIRMAFERVSHPVFDPQGFLQLAIGQAHQNLVAMGNGLSLEARPRATCVACLGQDGGDEWGHGGDSRSDQMRKQQGLERKREKNHAEVLVQDGRRTEDEEKENDKEQGNVMTQAS